MNLGIDELIQNPSSRTGLKGKRVAFLGHNASATRIGISSLEALMDCSEIHIVSAFGPQHGLRSDKQDNMIETNDFIHPVFKIPVFSLYGKIRRPTSEMLNTFDILLVDLQDIGTRVYTYITTLFYMLEACSGKDRSVWILDRPNPVGRPVEGSILKPGWESFIGPPSLIMRHGLTIGEVAQWFIAEQKLDVEVKIIKMRNYNPESGPGFGWPVYELSWVNPSPNASSLNMARCYPGTVLIEGTTLSEGRGTTTPLEVIGAPDIDFLAVHDKIMSLEPSCLAGCFIRTCHFEPVFHKYAGELCSGIQIHTDNLSYQHNQFRPYRLVAFILKAIRQLYPEYTLWREFTYEYESERLAIDLLSGSSFLREWVDHPDARPADLNDTLWKDEVHWSHVRKPFLLY